jgi:hypothetical protein
VNSGLVLAEVEWLRLGMAERKGVPEPVGEAREVAGRVGRRRQQVDRRGDVPVLGLGTAGRTGLGSVGRPPAPRVVDVARPNRVRSGGAETVGR